MNHFNNTKKVLFLYVSMFILLGTLLFSACNRPVARPKIVIGLVIDQMRWDYLYRYYASYRNDGFKRLLRDGFSCQNTMINYIPAYTGPGHASIYTGSVPAINGIAGNNWIENQTGISKYCVDDNTVKLVGDKSGAPSMSPANLITTTITDELRLATNLQSRVYGVALKDRGSILPAGHLANAAYWYDEKLGAFTTSTYYPNKNPEWLQKFNKQKMGDSLIKLGWHLSKAKGDYRQSTTDATNYEKGFKGEKAPVFPHVFDSLPDTDRHAVLKAIPAGNTYTLMMAKACLEGEKLGKEGSTDFIAISLSSTDYAGHQFGPNSVELEDMYIKLDRELAAFFSYLDRRFGKDNYLFFLTADHGVAHNAEFMQDEDVPAGFIKSDIASKLNDSLFKEFKIKKETVLNKKTKKLEPKNEEIVRGIYNYQVFLNDSFIVKSKLDREKIKNYIIRQLKLRPEISYVIDMENMENTSVPEKIKSMAVNGYYYKRSGAIQLIFNPGWFENYGKTTGTTHGSWNPYDTHIPLIWYGWHIPKGETYSIVNMTDISPTLAALLHIQMPNGCIGKPIEEIFKKRN